MQSIYYTLVNFIQACLLLYPITFLIYHIEETDKKKYSQTCQMYIYIVLVRFVVILTSQGKWNVVHSSMRSFKCHNFHYFWWDMIFIHPVSCVFSTKPCGLRFIYHRFFTHSCDMSDIKQTLTDRQEILILSTKQFKLWHAVCMYVYLFSNFCLS